MSEEENLSEEKDFLEYHDEMCIHYIYSVGELSKFFLEVRDNKKLFGAKCTACGFVYFPPRANCAKCYAPTEWVELSGKGEIVTGTICHFGVSMFTNKLPISIAFIKLDGADMCFRHTVIMDKDEYTIENLKQGTKVRVAFRPDGQREGKITDFFFVLDK